MLGLYLCLYRPILIIRQLLSLFSRDKTPLNRLHLIFGCSFVFPKSMETYHEYWWWWLARASTIKSKTSRFIIILLILNRHLFARLVSIFGFISVVTRTRLESDNKQNGNVEFNEFISFHPLVLPPFSYPFVQTKPKKEAGGIKNGRETS